ncbi:MAG: serine/threonine-protein kinase [Deltaproteobacteria bacterium]
MVAVASINTSIRIGDRIDGRYRVLDLIADGGMGTVFLAEHVLIKRRVALKVLHRELAHDVLMVQRFLNEASAAGTLGHPNIVESTDMGFTPDGVPFIVFEYLDGALLTKEIYRVGGLPVRRAMRIATQIASALDAAHAAGIVHLDLKSDNIFLVEREGTLDHVKVLDFGIARFLGNDLDKAEVAGTPEFMAPEQITSPAAVDERADVYALGVVLYEMLCARRPFDDENQRSLLRRIVYEAPPALDRGVPEDLERLIGSMLAKEPSARPGSMKQVSLVLDELLDALESRAVPANEEDQAFAPPAEDDFEIEVAEVADVVDHPALPATAQIVALPARHTRRWPSGMLALAVLAGLAGGGAMVVEQRRVAGLGDTSVRALEADAAQLSALIESSSRALHQRAATIAATPVLRSAIATDAATLQDLIANEHVLVPQPGERLAMYQGDHELLRVPADAAPLGTGLAVAGDGLELAASATIAMAHGAVAVAAPLDLHVIRARLAGDALGATVSGLAQPLVVVTPPAGAGETPPREVVVPIVLPRELGAPLTLRATIRAARSGELLTTARDASFAMAGALVLCFVVIGAMRRRA